MKIILWDCETTGLPDFNRRARDPAQPHLCQVAAELFDETGKTLEAFDCLVKPDGWTIPAEATAFHGITTDAAKASGIPERDAAQKLFDMIKKADLMVAFNVTFDKFLARIALRRYDIFTDQQDSWWKLFPTYCPMRKMTDICQLPATNGKSGFKFPKLQEAYKFAFAKEFIGAHGAVADCQATKELYFWLKARGE
jgi:DNA polymerase-3 subunit epsilon